MGNDLGSRVGLIEPVEDSNGHLLVTRTFIKTSKTMVPVRGANIAPAGTITIKGDLLTKCCPLLKINSLEYVEEKRRSSGTPAQVNIDLKHLMKKEAQQARKFLRRN